MTLLIVKHAYIYIYIYYCWGRGVSENPYQKYTVSVLIKNNDNMLKEIPIKEGTVDY